MGALKNLLGGLSAVKQVGVPLSKGGGFVEPEIQAETTALVNKMATDGVTAPSADAQTYYNRLIYALKQGGVWSKLDRLFLAVTEVEAQCRYDLINAVVGLTVTNAPTFVGNGGFYGNAANQAYTTNFTPSTAGGKFQRDSAFIGCYQLDARNSNADDCGNTNVTLRGSFRPSGDETMPVRINQATSTSVPLTRSQVGAGLAWASRDDATTIRAGKGATKIGTYTVASTALGANPILFGGGRATSNPNYSPRRLGALIIGQSLSDAEVAVLSNALDAYMVGMLTTTLTLDTATTAQTILGLGFELQSDSIEGDGGGIQESNTSSLPLDLSSSERTRFASQIVGLGAGWVDFRLAAGLYYRGTTSDGKRFTERLPGQNAAIKELCDATGVGICFTHWSPPPFYKKNGVYRGSTDVRPDPVADPSGYNTYLRRLLQGGYLDAPDKVADPTGYAAWMADFAANTVLSMEYIHQNCGPIRRFVAQNEPHNRTAYPSCEWTNEQMYDYLKEIVPRIRASSILSTYGGQANTVKICSDDYRGPTGFGGALIRADSALLAEIDSWSVHYIDDCAKDANFVVDSVATLQANLAGKAMYSSENEYFDLRVDPSQTNDYMEPGHRMTNLAMQVLTWMRAMSSPIWYPIHIGKPSTGPVFETIGRAQTIWRPTGAPVRDDYPSLAEGTFDTVPVNWHAMRGFLEHMPKNSVRVSFGAVAAQLERECYSMGWTSPGGKAGMCIVNRCRKANGIKLAGLPAGTYKRYRYNLGSAGVDMGVIANGTRFSIPADTIEFVVQQ
ncbi:hypothetical protein J2045_003320 [Peteryoungia aggregata LMG 23059]|uniref:Uncharacterized protein n=1 Tax=Peteryoungia aggregata LMG 23059 TaxID=1368425 RepID=A0ABU0GCD3_9HYPH|nr:hypothetical protein [Peteryoungia aggregata]MDQ0422272.1 hypothetical protein [Peteryoungia aggregata LMG 23059]